MHFPTESRIVKSVLAKKGKQCLKKKKWKKQEGPFYITWRNVSPLSRGQLGCWLYLINGYRLQFDL